ncbi:Asp-tRNA(Asn)/Glu-tRNA(Gln) amidotransferase subunit GatB [Myxococcota bacterium]|nr:Asp-tRNA(Asn)/Glu-tRNA(Gln) amidotransferase subunit GatB [Myxococcota bacterium]
MDYEVVIGLEVHTQLRTESKLFSPAPVSYGEEPNHSVHPVCLALPGVLPVLNGQAVELAIRAALATHCEIHPYSVFARKNYFYPDLPKGYQISQYEEPLATGGWIDIELGEGLTKRVRLTRIHMEEDAGKSIHDSEITGGHATHVDLNRAGIPLLEIVSEPDLRSPAEAAAYLRTLRSILRYVDVTDADMEKGHFRCDANISLREPGTSEFGTRTELKNLNSFRFVEEALHAEIDRQGELLDDGVAVQQATMAFDASSQRTRVLRLKEDADDYRYFPDPDLIPLQIDLADIDRVRDELPELPEDRRARFREQYALSDDEAVQLTASRASAEFFEAAVVTQGSAKPIAKWMLRDLAQVLGQLEIGIEDVVLTPDQFAALVGLVEEGRVTPKSARELLPELVERGGDPTALASERGLEAVTDSGVLEGVVDQVIADHPEDVERYRAGEGKVLNFLMGQVMRRTEGKADPGAVRDLLSRRLS